MFDVFRLPDSVNTICSLINETGIYWIVVETKKPGKSTIRVFKRNN